ncbi:MAG: zeta toxin family protein [Chloroflexota bacterium]|nr:zeta toxin family protein [Chloroflexota bacterium]MDQ5867466.1 zeta toxin family protein [Chloroflexota bacterium]
MGAEPILGAIEGRSDVLASESRPVTVLLSGAPGTGKSTIQHLAPSYFRERIGEAASIGTDEIYTIVDPDWLQTNHYWKQIARDNCIILAKNLFAHGVQVVVIGGNDLYSRGVVNQYLAALLPVSAVLHFTLAAEIEAVVDRVDRRGDLNAHPAEWLSGWLQHVRKHVANWTRIIDTTHLTPEQTLEIIYQKVIERDGELKDLIASET